MYVQKKRGNVFVDNQPSQRVADLLAESEKAIRAGDSQRAYDLSLQATQVAPNNIEAWFLRATLAPSLEERLVCVNHLNELSPNHQDWHNVAYFALKDLLDKNPYLAYLEETEALYRVLNADHMVLSIPKKRSAANSAPSDGTSSLQAAYRLLVMAILGLLVAGIGTLIFAPLAAIAAIQGGLSLRSQAERVSSTVILVLSIVLFFLGAGFAFLFVIHLTG